MTRTQRIESRSLVRRMKSEIAFLMQAGTIPASATSFSELHEYLDANTLGDTEAMLEEGMPMSEFCDIFNAAVESIDDWLKRGEAQELPSGC